MSDVEHSYRPQDDPFVLAHFESLLEQRGIEYRKNELGFYVAPEQVIDEIYIPLGEIASTRGLQSDSIIIDSDCAAKRLEEHLDANGVIYHHFSREGLRLIKTTRADSEQYNLMGYYAKFKHECVSRS
ncbi:hypothetical protein [Motiliproteus sediminis]|uniref:hypothetical protein n=1 Tax=Motiliproteus sediminis TaxID=1468178 RepID=UPI001AF02584|nr:hypothetical protein [Motiliproteus sediminis]